MVVSLALVTSETVSTTADFLLAGEAGFLGKLFILCVVVAGLSLSLLMVGADRAFRAYPLIVVHVSFPLGAFLVALLCTGATGNRTVVATDSLVTFGTFVGIALDTRGCVVR